jgi:hypothetical protein
MHLELRKFYNHSLVSSHPAVLELRRPNYPTSFDQIRYGRPELNHFEVGSVWFILRATLLNDGNEIIITFFKYLNKVSWNLIYNHYEHVPTCFIHCN